MKAILYLLLALILFACMNIGYHAKECPPVYDYQIEINKESVMLWDGKRFVGSYRIETFTIDSLIKKDNE